MLERHSVYPVDSFTRGVADADLRGLVERHCVGFEIGKHDVVGASGAIARRGWVVDLYGRPSPADIALRPGEQKNHHVHDVLHAIAATLVPEDRRGWVAATLEQFTGAVRIDTRRDFAEETRLRIQIEPLSDAPISIADDTAWRDELIARLTSLGARHRGG